MKLEIEALDSYFVKRYKAHVLELDSSSDDNARRIKPLRRAIKSIKNFQEFAFYDDS